MAFVQWLALLCCISLGSVKPFSSKPVQPKPIERVAIIGTGIAGLATAHGLTNSVNHDPIQVSLFDSRPTLDYTAGAGIQINGGLRALRMINPDLMERVWEACVPQTFVRSRTKSWLGKSPFDTLLELDLEKEVRGAGIGDLMLNGKLLWGTILRGALQETLFDCLPDSTDAQFGKTLTGLLPHEIGDGIICEFSDGSTAGPFDMVIGCDGIKSAVKEYVESGKISKLPSQREGTAAAIYTGIRIRYAIQDGIPSESSSAANCELRQYFGDGAFALKGTYGAGAGKPAAKGAFVIFLDDEYFGPFRRKESTAQPTAENADWMQNVQDSKELARANMLQQVKTCNLPDFDVGPVIEQADRFYDLGVYFHNPFSFSGWSKQIPKSGGRYAVLCGDAAHAMPPFLGQGGNQAIQDGYSLSMKIHQHNAIVRGDQVPSNDEDEPRDLKSLLKEYEKTRWLPTASITLKSALLGYLETGGDKGFYAKFRDAFFFVMGKIGVARSVLLDAASPKV